MDLSDEFNMVIKQVENPGEMNEDPRRIRISFIFPGQEPSPARADLFYEFVSLSIPMQRRCDEQEYGRPPV